jgi:hypothetical protein
MIVSHQYKFIFIKTHKTAGSSMEMALGPLCGPDDIVTPMESNAKTDIPRNYFEEKFLTRLYARSRLTRKCIDRHSPLLGRWFYEHMPAWRVRQLIGEEVWNSYHKFCFERNPWDKVVSYYNWKKFGQNRSMPDFKTWVMHKTHRLPLDASLYFDGETCLMDEVLEYKGFIQRFSDLCQRLHIPYNGTMPREKTNITSQPVDYREFYDDETREKVAHEFSREIRFMNYVFDPASNH